MDIHRKIFQIPVIDTDDPCAGCKRHLHFLLVMGFHQCRQAKFSGNPRVFRQLHGRENRADQEHCIRFDIFCLVDHVFVYREIFSQQRDLYRLPDLRQIFILPLKICRFRQYRDCIRSCCFVFLCDLHIRKFRCDQSLGGRRLFHLADKAHPLLCQCLFKRKSRITV